MKPLTDRPIHHILPLLVGATLLIMIAERSWHGVFSFTVPLTTITFVLILFLCIHLITHTTTKPL